MVYSYGLDAVKDIAVNGDMHLTKNSLEKVWHADNTVSYTHLTLPTNREE